ncbi:MAG: FAD synthetase family protein [Verrucomicrobia bacterium]|nr:FAD synthetase family protein [Verrucomicrobiota bacterium]
MSALPSMESCYMKIFHSLEEISALPLPIALTIGVFDGVHIGHQHLLSELKKHGTPVVLTFSNHPSEVLPHRSPVQMICSLEKRLLKLEQCGVAATIVLPFTKELSQTSYDAFLRQVYAHLPFATLLLGEGESFGHHCEGTPGRVSAFGEEVGFKAIYLEKIIYRSEFVSSKRIRALQALGLTEEANSLLNNPSLHA